LPPSFPPPPSPSSLVKGLVDEKASFLFLPFRGFAPCDPLPTPEAIFFVRPPLPFFPGHPGPPPRKKIGLDRAPFPLLFPELFWIFTPKQKRDLSFPPFPPPPSFEKKKTLRGQCRFPFFFFFLVGGDHAPIVFFFFFFPTGRSTARPKAAKARLMVSLPPLFGIGQSNGRRYVHGCFPFFPCRRKRLIVRPICAQRPPPPPFLSPTSTN